MVNVHVRAHTSRMDMMLDMLQMDTGDKLMPYKLTEETLRTFLHELLEVRTRATGNYYAVFVENDDSEAGDSIARMAKRYKAESLTANAVRMYFWRSDNDTRWKAFTEAVAPRLHKKMNFAVAFQVLKSKTQTAHEDANLLLADG